MDFETRVMEIIGRASSPSDALAAVAAAVARDELSEACGVFLAGPEQQLTLWARSGVGLASTRAAAEETVHEAIARLAPVANEQSGRVIVAAPLLSHARPIGALVVERAATEPYSTGEMRRLVAIASHVVGVIESARLSEMIAQTTVEPAADAAGASPPPRSECVLSGIAASPGVVVGACAFRQVFPRSLLRLDVARHGAPVERERLRDAVEKTRNDLIRLQASIAVELGEEQALVFGSHLMLLADPMLHEQVERGIANGQSAAVAIDSALAEITSRLRLVTDAYLSERVEDLEDVCSRVLGHLLGASGSGAPLAPQLVVSQRVTPSLVLELHGRGALGIASEIGGSTSHAVLLARALGFPAVTGVEGLMRRAVAGEPLVIDGDRGVVVLSPAAQTIDGYRTLADERERARTAFGVFRDRAPVTADGFRFGLRANVAFAADIDLARANNAEGIGLYRTEFPFIVRDGIPTLEEQARIYAKAYQVFPEQVVVFRLLDVAADKLVPRTGLEPAANVFQGYRSIRLLFDHPHLVREQVQAFAIAAAGRPLSILVPMVASVEELRRIKALIAAALAAADSVPPSTVRVGALIEVPAAVEVAAELAREADFLSVGTNDLIQYALVIDRDDPRLSTPLDAYHPAVLRMVRRVVAAGHAAGKEVSVCGEIAARFELAFALLAIGVDVLSVNPRAIPELKQKLADVAVESLRRDPRRILDLATAGEVEHAIRAEISGHAPTATTS